MKKKSLFLVISLLLVIIAVVVCFNLNKTTNKNKENDLIISDIRNNDHIQLSMQKLSNDISGVTVLATVNPSSVADNTLNWTLSWKTTNLYTAEYDNKFFYLICMYLYRVILNSNKSECNIKVLCYKDKSIYELEIEYQDLMIGYFGYNDETKETYFKFKIPKNEQSNNQIFKDYDLFYWTIDTDWKRCEIFNSETLKRIKRYYEELKGEKNND